MDTDFFSHRSDRMQYYDDFGPIPLEDMSSLAYDSPELERRDSQETPVRATATISTASASSPVPTANPAPGAEAAVIPDIHRPTDPQEASVRPSPVRSASPRLTPDDFAALIECDPSEVQRREPRRVTFEGDQDASPAASATRHQAAPLDPAMPMPPTPATARTTPVGIRPPPTLPRQTR
jgi:hypothetical protein